MGRDRHGTPRQVLRDFAHRPEAVADRGRELDARRGHRRALHARRSDVTWHREGGRGALALVGRRRLDRELEDELDTHLECSAADYMARGLSPDEARNAALRAFGGVARTQDG